MLANYARWYTFLPPLTALLSEVSKLPSKDGPFISMTRSKPIPRWDVHFGELDDDRKDSTAPHITFSTTAADPPKWNFQPVA